MEDTTSKEDLKAALGAEDEEEQKRIEGQLEKKYGEMLNPENELMKCMARGVELSEQERRMVRGHLGLGEYDLEGLSKRVDDGDTFSAEEQRLIRSKLSGVDQAAMDKAYVHHQSRTHLVTNLKPDDAGQTDWRKAEPLSYELIRDILELDWSVERNVGRATLARLLATLNVWSTLVRQPKQTHPPATEMDRAIAAVVALGEKLESLGKRFENASAMSSNELESLPEAIDKLTAAFEAAGSAITEQLGVAVDRITQSLEGRT